MQFSVKEDSDKCLIVVGLSSEVFVCLLSYFGQYQKIDARMTVEKHGKSNFVNTSKIET